MQRQSSHLQRQSSPGCYCSIPQSITHIFFRLPSVRISVFRFSQHNLYVINASNDYFCCSLTHFSFRFYTNTKTDFLRLNFLIETDPPATQWLVPFFSYFEFEQETRIKNNYFSFLRDFLFWFNFSPLRARKRERERDQNMVRNRNSVMFNLSFCLLYWGR